MNTYVTMDLDRGNGTSIELRTLETSLQDQIQQRIEMLDAQESDIPFFLADFGDVIDKYRTWIHCFPRVKPFYAVKCNDEYTVLKVLSDLGVNFDCASQVEIEKILSLGVSPDRIIYAHTIKHVSMLKYAAKHGVSMTTFDNEEELYKIKRIHPKAKCIIRLETSSKYKRGKVPVPQKFGCQPDETEPLLKTARSLELDVIGVSFHVGHMCKNVEAYTDSIRRARETFDIGARLGFNMELLDLGGGFPGERGGSEPDFKEFSGEINAILDQLFPAGTGTSVIAEPGDYFVASAFTLVTKIISKREGTSKQMELIANPSDSHQRYFMYYLNDGEYGSFREKTVHGFPIYPRQLKIKNSDGCTDYESSLWGQTCSSRDVISRSVRLLEHNVGDWLYFVNMGSYTIPLATHFNGMPVPTVHYSCLASKWYAAFPEN